MASLPTHALMNAYLLCLVFQSNPLTQIPHSWTQVSACHVVLDVSKTLKLNTSKTNLLQFSAQTLQTVLEDEIHTMLVPLSPSFLIHPLGRFPG